MYTFKKPFLQAWALIPVLSVSAFCLERDAKDNIAWIFQGGIFNGSIVGRSKVDGISGATKSHPGVSAGAEFKIQQHTLYIGGNIGKTDQHIAYHPVISPEVRGTRDISLLLLDIPVLYSFHLMRDSIGGDGKMVIGLGGFASVVLSEKIESHPDSPGSLPGAKVSNVAAGPFFKVLYYPLAFGKLQTGVYFDFYRSFVPVYFYDDPYFRENNNAGQLGVINLGISVRMK